LLAPVVDLPAGGAVLARVIGQLSCRMAADKACQLLLGMLENGGEFLRHLGEFLRHFGEFLRHRGEFLRQNGEFLRQGPYKVLKIGAQIGPESIRILNPWKEAAQRMKFFRRCGKNHITPVLSRCIRPTGCCSQALRRAAMQKLGILSQHTSRFGDHAIA
jgi:hypothetical protein